MTGFGHGLVIGKFYPPHAGHHHLIRTAAARCERLTVLAEAARVESVPLADRVAWLRAEHPDVSVLGAPCDVPTDFADEAVWAAQVAIMRAALGPADVDAVFTSEPYGDELAARFGAVHVCVDPDRTHEPISASAVRADLAGHWDRLAPATRAGLAVRLVFVGSESTGTTTVSTAVAEHYRARGGVWARTGWVAEYGREYTEILWRAAVAAARSAGCEPPPMEAIEWDHEHFAVIAAEQTRQEDEAAAVGSPLLVCDTDALATAVWERRYLGSTSPAVDRLAGELLPPRTVYLLTDHVGVPFVQDGMRDGEHVRADMTQWFVQALVDGGHSWVLLTGPVQARVALALRVAEQLLEQRATFAAPLG